MPEQAAGHASLPVDGQGDGRSFDLVDALWRALCSLKLALFLILAISAASVAGALLMQVPGSLTAAEYAQWLDRLRPRYGAFADIFSALGLLNVFGSWWFRGLLGLLGVSVVICTLDRWPRTWRAIRRPNVRTQDAFFAKAANRATFGEEALTVAEAASAVENVLRARGYRVRRENEGDASHLYADRNWFGRLGSFLNHLALVLILAGAVVGGLFGFRDRDFAVPEGSTRAVGHDTKLSLKVESFVDEYYPEGPPKDFRSEVVLYDGGAEVKRGTIRVNEPLAYDGIRFYQSFFGPAVVLQVKTLDGKLTYDDGVPLVWRTTTGDRPIGSITLPDQGLGVDVVGPSSANREPDPLVPGWPDSGPGLPLGRIPRRGDGAPLPWPAQEDRQPRVHLRPGAPVHRTPGRSRPERPYHLGGLGADGLRTGARPVLPAPSALGKVGGCRRRRDPGEAGGASEPGLLVRSGVPRAGRGPPA